MTGQYADRIFMAGRDITVLEISAAVSEAYDILTDGGISPGKAADLAAGAERAGQDPVWFARHFLKLRASLQDHQES